MKFCDNWTHIKWNVYCINLSVLFSSLYKFLFNFSLILFLYVSMRDFIGESMAMSGIYGLRNSLSESNSSLSNSSMNGSCIGTSFVSGTTPTGSSPDDSSMQLSASLTSNPFSHLTSVSLSSSGSLNTPIKNFDNLQVKKMKHSKHTQTDKYIISTCYNRCRYDTGR